MEKAPAGGQQACVLILLLTDFQNLGCEYASVLT